MSCQRVLSLLSAYMDNEVCSADARMLEGHLAGCASCSRELALLQVTARMLASTPDVEPPGSLLEQIEAATIRRPSIWQRLGVPTVGTYGRWAASAAVAAAILLAILVSRPPHQTANQPTDRPQPPIAVHPEFVERPTQSPGAVIARKPVKSHPRREHRPRVEIAMLPAKKPVAKAAPIKPARKLIETKADLAVSSPPAAEQAAPETSTTVASAAPEPAKEVKVAQAATKPADSIQKENDSLAQLRAQLAAKNKNKKVQVKNDPIEGHKVSVALASIRF